MLEITKTTILWESNDGTSFITKEEGSIDAEIIEIWIDCSVKEK